MKITVEVTDTAALIMPPMIHLARDQLARRSS
jgi:hypothetical protein